MLKIRKIIYNLYRGINDSQIISENLIILESKVGKFKSIIKKIVPHLLCSRQSRDAAATELGETVRGLTTRFVAVILKRKSA